MKKLPARRKMLNKKLLAYSATAGAATLGAPGASAAINLIDTTNLTFNGSAVGPLNLPIVSSGAAMGTFKFGDFPTAHYLFYNHFPNTNQVAAFASIAYAGTSRGLALKFNLGDPITSSARLFSTGSLGPVFAEKGTSAAIGNFQQALGGTGYFGFKIQDGTDIYFGWLRAKVTFDLDGSPISFSLIPKAGSDSIYGAYGDHTITAGAIPEPSSVVLTGLGLLALGAGGVREMRRRRNDASSASRTTRPEQGS